MPNIKKNNQGFTFIEALVYLAIVGVVISSFITFSPAISAARSKAYVVQEVQANTRIALGLIARTIRQAGEALNPAPGTAAGSLTLDMPGASPDIMFSITSGVLYITEGMGDPTAITSDEINITSLVFTNLALSGDRDNIRVEITAEYGDSGSLEYTYSQSLRTAVSIRQ